jgi:hypothetical protein
MACSMRFGPHLCSSPPRQADIRDLLQMQMGLRHKQITQTPF